MALLQYNNILLLVSVCCPVRLVVASWAPATENSDAGFTSVAVSFQNVVQHYQAVSSQVSTYYSPGYDPNVHGNGSRNPSAAFDAPAASEPGVLAHSTPLWQDGPVLHI